MRNDEIQDLLNIIAALVMRTGATSITISGDEMEKLCGECEGKAFSIAKSKNGELKITLDDAEELHALHEDESFPNAKAH